MRKALTVALIAAFLSPSPASAAGWRRAIPPLPKPLALAPAVTPTQTAMTQPAAQMPGLPPARARLEAFAPELAAQARPESAEQAQARGERLWCAPPAALAAASMLAEYGPYLKIGALAAGAWTAHKTLPKAVDKLTARAGWEPNNRLLARWATVLGIWGSAIMAGLHLAGAPDSMLKAMAGLGATAATFAAKPILSNALEATKVLAYNSFAVGDRLRVGAERYQVADLNLRYVTLAPESQPGALTNFTYLQLTDKPLTVLRPFLVPNPLAMLKPAMSLRQAAGAAWRTVRSAGWRTWVWTAGSLAAAVGLSFTPLSYLQAAAFLTAAHHGRKLVRSFLSFAGEKAGWNPQKILVANLIGGIASYATGASLALHAVGMTWATVLGSLGVTGLAFTLATSDILSNLFQAGWLMTMDKNETFKIGDAIEIAGVSGRVAGMNFQYVTLDHEDGTHTLVSYSVFKGREFTLKKASKK